MKYIHITHFEIILACVFLSNSVIKFKIVLPVVEYPLNHLHLFPLLKTAVDYSLVMVMQSVPNQNFLLDSPQGLPK